LPRLIQKLRARSVFISFHRAPCKSCAVFPLQ
jgi:hypothetical protein